VDERLSTAASAAGAAVSGLRVPAHRVSPRARWYWTVRAALGWAVLVAAQIVVLLQIHGDRAGSVVVLTITAVVAGVHIAVMPQWRYRVHRWEVTGTAAYTQSGWFNQQRRIAPLSRIQTVDTERGPVEQLFRLANVTVTTASAAGPLKIHGLALDTAQRLVADLTAATARSEGDAT
jgi:membrane protein YdbS with pleckstrin-like domain